MTDVQKSGHIFIIVYLLYVNLDFMSIETGFKIILITHFRRFFWVA